MLSYILYDVYKQALSTLYIIYYKKFTYTFSFHSAVQVANPPVSSGVG